MYGSYIFCYAFRCKVQYIPYLNKDDSILYFFILYTSSISISCFLHHFRALSFYWQTFLQIHLHIQDIIIPFVLRRCRISFQSGGDPDTTFPLSSSVCLCKCPDTSQRIWQQFSGIRLGSQSHYKALLVVHRISNEIPPYRGGFKTAEREERVWLSFLCIIQVPRRDSSTSARQTLEICFNLMEW